MQFRWFLFSLTALLLTACNMTLARDVTPPPGAVQQVPAQQPTPGPLYPPATPNIQKGAALYAEKCAPCHGPTGQGDGPMSAQLTGQGISVAALGSPEVARAASPADWFQFVTVGNMQKFMPAFNSLNEQQRWDVVAYAMSLSVTPQQIEQGQTLYEKNCAECHARQPEVLSLERLSQLSPEAIQAVILSGKGEQMPAFADFSDDELWALSAYLRGTAFGASLPTPLTATVTSTAESTASVTPSPAEASGTPSAQETPLADTTQAEASGTPSAQETPLADATQTEGSPEATAQPQGIGTVSGKIVHGSGGKLPASLSVTLRGFEHTTQPNAQPQEVVHQTTTTAQDDTFRFEDVNLAADRIFFVEVEYQGVIYQSELAFGNAGESEISLPDIKVYESTADTGALVIDELFVFTEFNADGTVRVFEQFYLTNQSNQTVTVETDGSSVPFLPLPGGGSGAAFQISQDSAPLLTYEKGFALPPSSEQYGIIAFYTFPYEKKLELALPFALPVSKAQVVVPEGIQAKSPQLTDEGVREMQPGARFQIYSVGGLQSGETLKMTLSGKVKSASASGLLQNQSLLIGLGSFGLALILVGVWLYVRDRQTAEDEYLDEESNAFESAEEVMDAIIALDDLHRAGKIPDEAYQARRQALKERLQELS